MVEYQGVLHAFFKEFLTEEDVARLFPVLELVHLKSRVILFERDQEAGGVYFVVSGEVAVLSETGFGKRKQVVALLHKGAPVGENGLLTAGTHGRTVVAVEESTLLHLSRSSFEQLCEERPEFGIIFFRWLLGRVSLRLKGSTERLAHIL